MHHHSLSACFLFLLAKLASRLALVWGIRLGLLESTASPQKNVMGHMKQKGTHQNAKWMSKSRGRAHFGVLRRTSYLDQRSKSQASWSKMRVYVVTTKLEKIIKRSPK
ncbi:hypothetical protein DdX_03510 [Ditylenchus destructor]|uniref:Secreted protein n=1 Tax=Ditylenchus destructor TaxID=166010 RepID=A0AAD4RBD5_9BILA|nr:hypothetical protein DdX_03510 [Ditylenchus destructor]